MWGNPFGWTTTISLHLEMSVQPLNLHVPLTADVAVNNKQPSSDECTPAAEVQTEVKDRDVDTADEEPCCTSAVLGNIPVTLNQEFLEMLVENVVKDPDSPSATQSFTLELIPDISSAVVTFQGGKGTHSVFKIKETKMLN